MAGGRLTFFGWDFLSVLGGRLGELRWRLIPGFQQMHVGHHYDRGPLESLLCVKKESHVNFVHELTITISSETKHD